MTSPWLREPSDQITCMLTLSLRNLTEPSAITTFAPPGCRLASPNMPGWLSWLLDELLQLGYFGLGASRTLPSVWLGLHSAQSSPRIGVLAKRAEVDVALVAHFWIHAGKPAVSVGLGMFSVPLFRAAPAGSEPTMMMSLGTVTTLRLPL